MKQSAPVRVLHVISGLEAGGAEAMLAKLVLSARRYRHEVVSLAGLGAHGAALEAAGIPVRCLEMESLRGLVSGPPALAWHLRKRDADLVMGWMNHGILAATLAHRLSGRRAPLLWNIRQTIVDWRFEKPTTRRIIGCNARLSRAPRAIVYNSAAGAAAHEAIGFDPSRRRIIPNGFDLSRFSPDPVRRVAARRALGIGEGEIAIGLVARFDPLKNHRGFFEAAAQVLDFCPEARFVLAGGGITPDNAELIRLIADERVRQRTLLLGLRGDIPDLTRALDIACNVSFGEGFANTIGEAMASGVPCIVTDCGDSADIVGSTGILCENAEPAAIASAIRTLVTGGPELRAELGRQARVRAETEFSIDGAVAKYELAFDEALGMGGAAVAA